MSGNEHILVVDDDAEVRDLLIEYLAKQGFVVTPAESAACARDVLDTRAVDLVVLDLQMPGEDGLSFARDLRRRSGVAIVMLTASGDTIDRVVGLEVGADDYVAKPFDPREFLARIRSVLRRTRRESAAEPVVDGRTVRFGRCLFDLEARRLYALDGSEVPITAMQLELLEAFANNPNRVLSRDRLLDLAHKRGSDPFDRSIDIRVARLRQKIEPNPEKPQAIRTVHGIGYVFVPSGQGPSAEG
ncbi:response regulator [Azospirillum canadense]|uniref:response regulator n=1 Tax=Azospirillum canadense TaxID=403962 RepID=UPI0022269C0E|nr:response regulator [Azospirillum canadense]MCW2242392.1 two-component system phosphate regulon response regulator OmpR [Azospirillum canadense]